MFNTLVKSLEIDITYSTNSFIYILRKLPILKDLFTDDIYKSKIIKKIVNIFTISFNIIRALFLKFFYFFIILVYCYQFFPNNIVKTYFHTYFFLTTLGMFINNKLLNTSKQKYFSLLLFNMDATNYFKSNIFFNSISNLILNSTCILLYGHLISSPIIYSIILILLSLFIRYIGEYLNIEFYKKYNYIWYSNSKLYISIILLFLAITLLPFINIFISLKSIIISTIIIVILGSIALKKLLAINDYKLIYKKLSQITNVMNSKYDKDYLKQAMIAVRDKDKKIDNKKIINKKGYDLFNTIFFERHKEILIRSAKKYSLIIIIAYIVLIYFALNKIGFKKDIYNILNNHLGYFTFIMFFINRGAIITQAMFFNCDHAMLKYNFYKEPKVLLKLFKKRLLIVTKVNLLPAIIIGIGNTVLLFLVSKIDILRITATFIFIISSSILFSIHYLVMYYLLQPFDENLEVKKISYEIVTLVTYFLTYQVTNLTLNPIILSLCCLVVTILYIIISRILIYKLAPKTFKLK